MREPTRQELWYLEDYFSTNQGAGDVSISLNDSTETGWTIQIDYDIMEDGECTDTVAIDADLWYDEVEDTFHISLKGQVQ